MRLGLGLGLSQFMTGTSTAALSLSFVSGSIDSRITFTRASLATMYDSTGKLTYAPNNLVTHSNDFSNIAWTKDQTGSITTTGLSDPLGGVTASTFTAGASGGRLYQNANGPAANYVNSIWLKRRTGTGQVNIFMATGASTNVTITSSWAQYTFSGSASAGISFVGVGLAVNGDAVDVAFSQFEAVTYETTPRTYNATVASAYHGARLDHNPSTLAPLGLLIEEARTNVLTRSAEFSHADWGNNNLTITANAVNGLDGIASAELCVPTATSAGHFISATTAYTVPSAGSYQWSIYVKAAGYSKVGLRENGATGAYASFNLATGTVIDSGNAGTHTITNPSITSVGNGWYRLSMTLTTAGASSITFALWIIDPTYVTGTFVSNWIGDTTSGVYVWGAQLEAGAFATSYIPTVAATVTRAADAASMTGVNFSSWYAATGGTFVVDYTLVGSTAASSYPLGLSDSAALTHFYGPTALNINAYNNFNSSVGSFDTNTIAASTPLKLAVAFAANDRAISKNGAIVVSSAAAWAVPAVLRLDIGDLGGTGAYRVGLMHMHSIQYHNSRKTNAELVTLST